MAVKSNTIDGTKIAQRILAELNLTIKGKDLGLAAVFIGNDPALKKFVDLKKKAAQSIGMEFSSYEIEPGTPIEEIQETMRWLAGDDQIQGMLVELPLPKELDTQQILNFIPPSKDVDVLTTELEEKFYKNQSSILPPAVEALKIIFQEYTIDPQEKTIAVFGQGRLVGKPVSHWLKTQGAKVIEIDENTKKPATLSQKADIVITAVGKPGLITDEIVKEDVVVIDYGYGKKGDTMAGDVDFEKVSKKASLITPVPGGMGPLVIAAVLKNLVSLSH